MENKKKIFVLIDNEFTVRNFVLSGAFDDLAQRYALTFVFPAEGWKLISIDPADLPLPEGTRILRVFIPERRIYLWRILHMTHQMRIRFDRAQEQRRKLITGFSHWKARILYTVLGLPGIFWGFKRYTYRQLAENDCSDFRDLLEAERPDAIIHPSVFSGYFVNDFVAEGKRLGIPTALIMNSWDNPSLKCTMSGQPDVCVVWGQQTVNHAQKYMGLPSEKIAVLGAAQFEIHRQPPRIDRTAFCAEHGIDPSRKLVLYAGSSRRAREYEHLSILSQAIDAGDLPASTIVYRPHPWGGGGADGTRILREPLPHVVVENSMKAYLNRVSDGAAKMSVLDSEYARAHDILSSIDVLISPLSTIILEGILHMKPVMCFIPGDEAAASKSLGLRIGLDHFAELFRSPAMLVGHSRDDLVDLTRQLIERSDDPEFRTVLKSEAKFFVEFPAQPYSAALADFVDDLVERPVDSGAAAGPAAPSIEAAVK